MCEIGFYRLSICLAFCTQVHMSDMVIANCSDLEKWVEPAQLFYIGQAL